MESMLDIENSRLRSVPEYRHQFARSLAEIVHRRGHIIMTIILTGFT